MSSKLDPNKAFRNRFFPKTQRMFGKTPSGARIVMIRCNGVNCGHKTLISHDRWIGTEEITCSNCGSEHNWDVL